MKIFRKSAAVLVAVLMLLPSSVIAGNAITVERNGRQYHLGSDTPTTGELNVLLIVMLTLIFVAAAFVCYSHYRKKIK